MKENLLRLFRVHVGTDWKGRLERLDQIVESYADGLISELEAISHMAWEMQCNWGRAP